MNGSFQDKHKTNVGAVICNIMLKQRYFLTKKQKFYFLPLLSVQSKYFTLSVLEPERCPFNINSPGAYLSCNINISLSF